MRTEKPQRVYKYVVCNIQPRTNSSKQERFRRGEQWTLKIQAKYRKPEHEHTGINTKGQTVHDPGPQTTHAREKDNWYTVKGSGEDGCVWTVNNG